MKTEKIRKAFADYFKDFKIKLPKELEKKGRLSKEGWSITYVQTTDDDGNPCLEFLASHRMAGMNRVRIQEDGTVVALPTIEESYGYDSTVAGDKERAEAEWQAHNKRVADEMQAKGLI